MPKSRNRSRRSGRQTPPPQRPKRWNKWLAAIPAAALLLATLLGVFGGQFLSASPH